MYHCGDHAKKYTQTRLVWWGADASKVARPDEFLALCFFLVLHYAAPSDGKARAQQIFEARSQRGTHTHRKN